MGSGRRLQHHPGLVVGRRRRVVHGRLEREVGGPAVVDVKLGDKIDTIAPDSASATRDLGRDGALAPAVALEAHQDELVKHRIARLALRVQLGLVWRHRDQLRRSIAISEAHEVGDDDAHLMRLRDGDAAP